MGRPSGRHIDSEELDILVPWSTGTDAAGTPTSVEPLREVHRHLAKCSDCRKKLMRYRQLVSHLSNATTSRPAAANSGCPNGVDWNEVVGGLWPEMKAEQVIRHAALCDHCGPLLRAATRDHRAREKRAMEPAPGPGLAVSPERRWHPMGWLIPLSLALVILAVLIGVPLSSPTAMSGASYAEFAVHTHEQLVRENFVLDVHSDSQQAVNDWLKQNAQFTVALPVSPGAPDEKRPYRLEGASLVQVAGKRAAFIAYQMDSGPASLMVAPSAVAVASGGVEAHFKKVTFHYRMVNGFKVVTWSQHGLTYALVSAEGKSTQKSCMVCHSAMRDRDLSNTPTPLNAERSTVRSYLQ